MEKCAPHHLSTPPDEAAEEKQAVNHGVDAPGVVLESQFDPVVRELIRPVETKIPVAELGGAVGGQVAVLRARVLEVLDPLHEGDARFRVAAGEIVHAVEGDEGHGVVPIG